jgi:DNA phosphorothioation system restriction enzyme
VLPHLSLQLAYRTGRDDLVGSFIVPCLEETVLYRRAAGYFTSSGLGLAARGIASLAARGGTMRLVASPHLEPDDVDALMQAQENPEEALRRIAARSLPEIEDAIIRDRLNALAWLAASGRLEIRLALRTDGDGGFSRGIFHEKSGVFTDAAGNHVAFTGSSNETAGGLLENFESIDVYRSWCDPEGRVEQKIADFEALWHDRTPGLKVIDFTDAGRGLLEAFREPGNPPPGIAIDVIKQDPLRDAFTPPPGFVLREYQREAIAAWSRAGGKGILAMATGTGKTVTALTLASKVAEKNKPMVLVVVCPFLNLCKQWIREMAAFGLRPLPCFEGKDHWQPKFEEGYQRLGLGLASVHAIVTTNKTFQSDAFQSCLRPHVKGGGRHHHLLIADEVHNLGAKAVSNVLPDGIKLRLGLSATPERHMDPEGTAAVLSYFGDIIFEFDIRKAIAQGHLCRYRYHPHLVELTPDEAAAYAEITAKLGPLLAGSEKNPELGQPAMNLLIKRARLLAGAENKIHVLDKVLKSLPEKPTKAIFYCGDGTTTDKVRDEDVRQIQAVARLLGEKHGLRVRNFTYRESPAEREEILRDLGSGFLDAVVAIRCLDEGIDLPDLRMGFLLASSTNPRQFVQRRGRLLRKAAGKKFAEIYDFVIAPPDLGGEIDDGSFNLERSLLQRELKRIEEFCNTADNGPEAQLQLQEIRKAYNILASTAR